MFFFLFNIYKQIFTFELKLHLWYGFTWTSRQISVTPIIAATWIGRANELFLNMDSCSPTKLIMFTLLCIKIADERATTERNRLHLLNGSVTASHSFVAWATKQLLGLLFLLIFCEKYYTTLLVNLIESSYPLYTTSTRTVSGSAEPVFLL